MSLFFLIGFMGSGKTWLGRVAADKLNLSFYDMDSMIESLQDKPLSQIFAEEGEDYFRQLEYDLLRKLPVDEDAIIATGGGIPCSRDNMEYMNSVGKTIYICLTPEQLKIRLEATDIDSRPLLSGKRDDDLFQYITSKLAERESFYKQANYIIKGEDEALIGKIIKIIENATV